MGVNTLVVFEKFVATGLASSIVVTKNPNKGFSYIFGTFVVIGLASIIGVRVIPYIMFA